MGFEVDPTIVDGEVEVTPADAALTVTWADVVAYAESNGVVGESFTYGIGTDRDQPIRGVRTWRIAVFATTDRNGEGYFVNVDELTRDRSVNTRLEGRYATAEDAMTALNYLTTFLNRWS